MSEQIPLLGYCDKLSGRPGDTIAFKVSSHLSVDYEARLVRIISADPNPEGPGMIEEAVDAAFSGAFPSRPQPFYPGSYVRIEHPLTLTGAPALEAVIWPTLVNGKKQVVLVVGEMALMVMGDGSLGGRLGPHRFSTGVPMKVRHWYRVRFSYDPAAKQVVLTQQETGPRGDVGDEVRRLAGAHVELGGAAAVSIAACQVNGQASCFFNGKIEAPAVYDGDEVVARWDFSDGISTTQIKDVGPADLAGELKNLPARGMTGSFWDGSEHCWRHRPEHYAAIHFHEDDIYDFGWENDFSFTIPEDLPSGVYAARIRAGDHEDAIPFFVCPPRRGPRAPALCAGLDLYLFGLWQSRAAGFCAVLEGRVCALGGVSA